MVADRSNICYVAGYTTVADDLVFVRIEDDILTALVVDSADRTIQLNNRTTQNI
jgi:hypothetical protein